MTLNSKGVEKAADALAKIYHGEGDEPFHLMATTAISAYLATLPPVDGLEVVAELNRIIAEEAADFADAADHAAEAGERPDLWDREVEVSVHTLSQASSVIAGLKEENEKTNLGWEQTSTQLGAALSRISSLEEEIKRQREAMTPSSSTKAAYMGEFSIAIERHINEDEEVDDEAEGVPDPYEHVTVPWTTIKEIMAAIHAYSQIGDHNG